MLYILTKVSSIAYKILMGVNITVYQFDVHSRSVECSLKNVV